ncbi:MAG: MFS transporter [Propionibacteriaceae bacterium]|nr:MFS transporter [Propionibacteriaceae bacterium]
MQSSEDKVKQAPRATHLVWLVVGMVLVGMVMRSPLSSVGPVLPAIRDDLGLSSAVAGLSGTIPLVCFSLLALLTPFLVARFGPEKTLGGALVVLTGAVVLRSAGSTTAFFSGTALAAMGIAVANVVIPAVVRERFPERVPTLSSMNVVVMNVGAALASAVALPLARDTPLGWTGALAIWAVPSLVALVGWTIAAKAVLADDHGHSRVRTPPTGMGRVARRLSTWQLAVMFGAQSAGFYTLLTWLATILRSHGVDPATAGLLVGILSALGIIGALGAGPFVQRGHLGVAFVTMVAAYTVGLVLLGVNGPVAVAGTLIAGVAQGACFSMVLTLISRQADPADVPATSALVQGVGYVIAGVAPFAAGALFDLSGLWWPPVLFVAGLMGISGVLGLIVTRR